MAQVTLATLISRVRDRCDMPVAGFIADSATGIYNYINRGLEIVHGKLAEAYGEEYLVTKTTLTTTANTETVALPSDFLKLLHLEILDGGTYQTLQRFELRSINAYRNASTGTLSLPCYRVMGRNIHLVPAPSSARTLQIYYVPTIQIYATGGTSPTKTRMDTTTDFVDLPFGWEAYAEVYAAIQCLNKEESDPSALMAELQRMDRELEELKGNRDAAHPNRVVDVELDDSDLYVR